MTNTFLTAEWRKLAMANYAADPKLLEPFLPYKTELDIWNGVCYVSLVGFMFQNTRLMGIKIPFHVNFEEVNLRFYVRYKDQGVWKRGVVFIQEIVPKPALTFVANTIYGEHYVTLPMRHSWLDTGEGLEVTYEWKKSAWNALKIYTGNALTDIPENSEAEFITEHYWGYTKISADKTSEYGVEHPRWQMYTTQKYEIEADFADLYGKQFGFLSQEQPRSVFLAEGSEILVKQGKRI